MPGAGTSSAQQSGTSSSKTSPWQPTQPLLKDIIGQLGGVNTAVTPYQQGALNQIQTNATGLPNYGGQATNLTNQLLGGIPNLNQNLASSAAASQGALSPYLQSNFLNPNTNPYTSQALNTLNQDLTNQIQGQFAGAGQSMGPAEAQALARGLGQGESGILMNQFNTNAGLQQAAAGQNMNIAGNANQALLGNAGAGIQSAQQIPGLANLSPLSELQAASMAYNLPLSQLGGVEGMTLPIAGLGSQTQGTYSQQGTQTASPLQQFATAGQGFNSFLNPFNQGQGGFSGFLNALPRFG